MRNADSELITKFAYNACKNTGDPSEAETCVAINFAKQLALQLQLRFGIGNLTKQKVVYIAAGNPFQQEFTEFGRRFNLGISLDYVHCERQYPVGRGLGNQQPPRLPD